MEILPFKPLLYNQDFSEVTSPPFDTITQEQEMDLKVNKYNITYLTLPGSSGYEGAKKTFRNWIEDKVLVCSDDEMVIILAQEFYINNELKRRVGMISLVNTSQEDGSVKPHERTFEKFVQERVNLMSELGCQLEPIFMTVPNNNFDRTLKRIISGRIPETKFEEPAGVVNYLYFIKEKDTIRKLNEVLKNDSAIIADGHHRLRATQKIAENTEGKEKEFWKYTMSYLTSIYDGGLQISGVHRMIKSDLKYEELQQALGKYFEIKDHLSLENPHEINLYDGRFHSLKPKEDSTAYIHVNNGISLVPAVLLNELILRRVFSMTDKDIEDSVRFTHDVSVAINSVDSKKSNFAFLMPEWDKDNFIELAMKNAIFPQKSTYFYPKIPSGIAINYFSR